MKARFFSSWTPPGVRVSQGVSPFRGESYDTLTVRAAGRGLRRNRTPRWIVVALAMLVLAPISHLAAYSLYLQDKTMVPAGPIRLGDIARVEGGEGRMADKLLFRNLNAPRYIGVADLRNSLKDNGPETLDRIYGAGTWIVPLGKELNAVELEDLLREQIAALPGGAELYQGSVLRLAANTRLKVPAEGVRLVFRLPSRAGSLTPGKRIIPLDIVPLAQQQKKSGKKNTVLARHQLQISILEKRAVAVATRDLPVGHRLTADDFRMEIRELDNDEIRFAGGDLLNRRVMSPTKSGTEFTTSNIQVMPAVRRGQSLSLVYQRPGLVFRVRSVALQSGEIGQTIPVRVLFPASSKRSVSGGDVRKSAQSRQLKARIVNETTAVFESTGMAGAGDAQKNVSQN